jgi:hypothetical protein
MSDKHVVFIIFIASGVGLSPLYCGHFWPSGSTGNRTRTSGSVARNAEH